jgi:hypothetical protein
MAIYSQWRRTKGKRQHDIIIEHKTTKECEFIKIIDNSEVTEIDSTIKNMAETAGGGGEEHKCKWTWYKSRRQSKTQSEWNNDTKWGCDSITDGVYSEEKDGASVQNEARSNSASF